MNLKDFKIKDLIEAHLQTEATKKESTLTPDVALPKDKAAGDTPAGKKNKKKKKDKLILGKDGEPKKGKSG